MPRYGLHLSIAGKQGIAGAAKEAELLGLSALQIFSKSPRAWKLRNLKAGELEDFRARRENLGLLPAVIHASYLVNLASSGELWEKSVFSLADDLQKAQALGIEYVVVHPGSGEAKQCRKGALEARKLAKVRRKGPKLLLENTAGGELGHSLPELAALIEGTPLGICFDTCHAFAAGYTIEEALDLLDHHIGLERVPVIHLNDSAEAFASGKDRHASLMEGQIGARLKAFVQDPRLADTVLILETPRGVREDAHNLRVLREWLEP
jgi:deoxyribonuclease-4